MAGRTVFTVLEQTAAQYGDAVALYQPVGASRSSPSANPEGAGSASKAEAPATGAPPRSPRQSSKKASPGYRTYSWNQWLQISREVALGLRALGLSKGDIVCILSETRAEFYLADIGVMGAGGVAAALYTAYPIQDLARNIISTGARFLFVEDSKTLAALSLAIEAQGEKLPEQILLLTGEHERALSLERLREKGRDALLRDPAAFTRIQEDLSPQDTAILYLTSGATGEPKMSLTSHAAVLANIDMGPVALPIGPEDSTLVFLPSAHIAQRIVLELVPMRMGTPVWFSESLTRLPAELKSVRPTIFLAPPRVWEKMYSTILNEVKKRNAIARKIFYGALGLGAEAAQYKQSGKPLPLWISRALKIAEKMVFSKIRERLGGRIRIAASGAAPLGKDLAEFFAAIGMPLIEGYGLTEAGVISFNPLDRPKPGSIGKLLPGVQARLTDDGELQVKTPCIFQGYYKDEAATRSVLSEDGWFSTGDIAEVDSDDYWYITGRKKELIVSSNGKKIYPARIENLFKMEPVINQVLLIGDKKPHVTALLTLNMTQLQNLKGLEDVAGRNTEEIVKSEPVVKAVQAAVSRVNKQLADFEKIRRFKVLDREFSIEHGELTPTMKIRRARVLENHRALVSELYHGREDGD